MSKSIQKLFRSKWNFVRLYNTSTDSVTSFTNSDLTKLFRIPATTTEKLCFNKNLPSPLIKQMNTLGELSLILRDSFFEISNCMEVVRPSFPALRLVLWGSFGTGKSVSLYQALYLAHEKNWVIINLKSALNLTRQVAEVEMSNFKSGRINDPVNAGIILQQFKQQNQHVWKTLSELKTEREYEWTKTEKTGSDRPITEIVEMGLSAPFLASDCIGALFRELKRHSSSGKIKTLVAIDDANSLWGKTLVKRADRTYASPSDLTLVQHYRNLISNNWSNSIILLVADKKEVADANDHLTVERYTPLELFGEEGFDYIEPFIPIETKHYSMEEMNNLYKYYVEKRWISSEKAKTDQGRLQMMHLSAFNPHSFERLAAFN